MSTKRLALIIKTLPRVGLATAAIAVAQSAAIFFLAQLHDLWPLAILVVLAVELGINRGGVKIHELRDPRKFLMQRVPVLLIGMSTVMIIAVVPRLATQVVVAIIYAIWRIWWSGAEDKVTQGLPGLLAMNAVVFEAIFLMAAVWRTTEWVILALVWGCAYLMVFVMLTRRGERVAGVMAATWALVCTEISWVLLRWLFTYTATGGYIMVPQPVLILTALGYCFGSIYVSQRSGSLSRGRLTEYLLIGLILIAIVITGTPWRGSL